MTNLTASRALAQVMELLRPAYFEPTRRGDSRGIAVNYGSEFSTLWNLHDQEPAHRTVLIWGSTVISSGVGDTNVQAHVSALAWATCALMTRKDLEVVIFDQSPERHRRETRLYRFVEAIQPERIPWLRLVTLENCGWFFTEYFARGEKADSKLGSDGQRKEMLQLLSQIMREDLTREGGESDRHAIQNIIGPMVLLGREYLARKGATERALLQVFEATGLVSKQQAQGNRPVNKIAEDSWGQQPLRLLLLDDQAECGWTDWVRSLFPSSQPGKPDLVSLDVFTLPEAFLDRLIDEWETAGKASDRRFAIELPGVLTPERLGEDPSNKRHPILLLDLRLHSLRSIESEAAFFQRLLPLCKRFETDDEARKFAWPGFSSKELEVVQEWCQNPKRESEEHFIALSLLPRLVALLDMSFPVIVFSSTGQRSIIEKLMLYGNIITAFEKPRFFCRDVRNVVAETQAKFGQAIEHAIRLLAARRKCALLGSIEQRRPFIEIPGSHKGYLELYLDETEEIPGQITVGGCFAFFTDPTSARDKADRFDDNLVRRGARYFESRGIGPVPESGVLMIKKRDGLADVLAKCLEDNTDAPQALGLLRLSLPHTCAAFKSRLLDPLEVDNGFRQCMQLVVELFLTETMPALFDSNAANIAVSIYAGTRVVELNRRTQQKKAQSDYGMGKHPIRANLFYSLGRSELFPIVANVLQGHGLERNTNRCIAVKLAYAGSHSPEPEWFQCRKCRTTILHTKREEEELGRSLEDALVCDCRTQNTTPDFRPDYRALHYLADDVLSNFPTAMRQFGRYDSLFKSSNIIGEFDEVFGADLETSVVASRALDQGNVVTAIARVHLPGLPADGSKPTASYLISTRIASQMAKLKGRDFVRLADELSQTSGDNELKSNCTPHA